MLGRAVKDKVQGRYRVNVQALEQAIAQETCRLVEAFGTCFGVAVEHTEVHLSMRVIGRDLHALQGDHAHARIFQFARDQLGQIALDLVGHFETAVRSAARFTYHTNCALQRTCDLFDFEEFQHIAFNDIVVVLDGQTALEVFFDFFGVVFETLQTVEFAREDDHVVAQQT